jgi:hypothetical protein
MMVKFTETFKQNCDRSLAEREYQRLCQLIDGKPPYGDCQLLALMISRAVTDSEIVQGVVEFEDGHHAEHFWVRSGGADLDPLAKDWLVTPIRKIFIRIVSECEIVNEYQGFIRAFPQNSPHSLFPLRWALRKELLKLSN